MKRVAFHTLGCKVNSYETDAMSALMREAGYTLVDFNDIADVYIINTCSVTNIADRKSRQMLHKAKKENPNSIIVATGCYAQEAGERLLEDSSVDIVVGNDKKKDIANLIDAYINDNKNNISMTDIDKASEYEALKLDASSRHTRAFIKIQDGCNQFCSYCIIPYVRGRVRSRSIDDIAEEIKKLAALNYKEFVLTGIHISSYGTDIKNENAPSLIDVIERVSAIDGVERIRLGSLEPRIIDEEFVKRLSRLPKFCPHMHFSLQSGDDDILKSMNRHYTTDEYFEAVCLLRKYFPHAALTTDIIVGFPGEGEREFYNTVEFVKKVNFYEVHIFPYSKREGTRAAAMPSQLSQKEKNKRVNELAAVQNERSKAFRESFIGEHVIMLSEEETSFNGKKYIIGHTPEYVKVATDYKENMINHMISGTAEGFLTDDLLYLGGNVDIL